jgi:hypothetical protein
MFDVDGCGCCPAGLCCRLLGGGIVVSKGRLGCIVFGVFAKRPAFASSVFFILAVLFVPTGGGGGDADRWRLLVS